MKKLFIIPLISILVLTFCLGGAVYAQEENEELAESGMTPDSPFYFMERWGEKLSLMFTFNLERKLNKSLQYANERLAEMDALLAQNKIKAIAKADGEYQYCLTLATKYMERAQNKGIDTTETLALAATKQLGFVNGMTVGAPEDALVILTQTRERAKTCQETALQTMAQGDPEKAIQVNLMLMEQHLNRIMVQVENHESTGLAVELQEYARLGNLGEQIGEIARQQGKEVDVDQLIGQATGYHLQILAQVHQQVQEQTQLAIEDAMQICIENHERVVTELKEQNQLGQVPEEAPIPEEIPENVRQRISSGETRGNN